MPLTDQATLLLALHKPGRPIVAPTVWDPWTAQIAAEQGFVALTVGSHPVATSMGRADNEDLSLAEMLARVALITDAVGLPTSADLEAGYGEEPARIVDGLLESGAVGLNLEDTVHSEGGRLRSTQEHADFIRAIRAAADETAVHVVVNARTDILLKQVGPQEDRLDRAIERLQGAVAAGADVLYPVGLHDGDTWGRLTAELSLPLNALARPDVDDLETLSGLGVGRISFGPMWQNALGGRAADLLAPWRPVA
ncbi:MAG: isocitrate lyase/phosphoenolpyruvate mutase family protein [Nocardioidaceae bacterium]|nr:isocitrate lyase/phosphoenolpyruvate mutase family protein [Nocardioidaceae bacterium]